MQTRYVLLTCIYLVALGFNVASGQTSCEWNSATLTALIQKSSPDDTVIAIARLGAKETNTNLNVRRLHNVKTFLATYGSAQGNILRRKVILAVGERAPDLGTVEVYVKGELFAVFQMLNNRDLLVGECAIDLEVHKTPCEIEEQQEYYPCLDQRKKRTSPN